MTTRVTGLATSAVVHSWQVQSSAVVGTAGEAISRPGYRADGWLAAPARSTVMAAVLGAGEYPDVLRSTRMRDAVDADRFRVPWWYRTPFDITAGGRTLLRLDGVIHRAELWVNGVLAAGPDEIAGAYPVTTVDVTAAVHAGTNALALQVFPGSPATDLAIGWIDWNPTPPDANMGVWRDVHLLRTGEIRLAHPYVVAELSGVPEGSPPPEGPSPVRARLRVGVEVDNGAAATRSVTVTGTIARLGSPDGSPRRFSVEVPVPPGPDHRVTIGPDEAAELAFDDPLLWWPTGHGARPRYELRLTASVAGEVSDQAVTTFGIRQVDSRVEAGGGRRFLVNGRPIQVLGAGWSPDIFLRHDRQRMRDQLRYAVDLGLNAIRLEGKLENPEFFDLADELGVMVLPGWECCTKWESHAGTGSAAWTEQDYRIAGRSMAGEARLLRAHPSVICFLIGSDFAPPERLADIYLRELRAADWSTPVVSSGASKWNNEVPGEPGADGLPDTTATVGAGPSGMKMWPYDWVPPVYWYDRRFGAAVGFSSESSAGHSIPRLPSLQRMLDPGEMERLWQQPETHQFHAAPRAPVSTLSVFDAALAGRYGPIGNLRDYLRKAQLANYEMVRAQFEAYGSRFHAAEPATGVIYWMLTSAWPSLNWHLFDYYLDPAGAYFGAKKANEAIHIQYAYDTGEVLVVNHLPRPAGPCTARVVVRRLDGAQVSVTDRRVDRVPPIGAVVAGAVTPPGGDAATFFAELELHDARGDRLSRNVYWLSGRPDTLDWGRTTWQYTAQQQYADLTGLARIRAVTLDVGVASAPDLDGGIAVTLHNPTPDPAVGIHLSLVVDGAPVAPILWQDNDITLFPGQRETVWARCPRPVPGAAAVRVEGFNVTDAVVSPVRAPGDRESGR